MTQDGRYVQVAAVIVEVLGVTNQSLVRCWLVAGLVGTWLLAGCAAYGEILWRSPEWQLIRENKGGTNLLGGKVPPHDDTSSGTLFFKFQVDPYSDSVVEYPGFYEAGMVLYEGGQPRLGVGNAWAATAYSAFNLSPASPQNATPGECDLHSRSPEYSKPGNYEVPRRGLVRTIVFKVQFVPGGDDEVTVWLSPNLWPGSREDTQANNSITRLKANASFNELRLIHRGAGKGWRFKDLAVATEFDDFVEPYPWEKGWVISTSGLVIIGLVAGGLWVRERRRSWRLQRERQRLEAVNAIERERARIARDIHDDLGATLSEIRYLSQFALSPDSPPERVAEDIKQIAAKALMSTQALDEIVWAVNPAADTLESFVSYACAFASEYLALAKVRFRLDLPPSLPTIYLRADLRHNLFLAFKETITNVVKHATASEVQIKIEITPKTLAVTVRDDGAGMTPETLSSANQPEPPGHDGLANMRSRLTAAGGHCEIASAPGQGTTVWLQAMLKPGDNVQIHWP